MKTKYLRAFCLICAAVMLTAALSISAFAAKSIEEQMADNSAAWWVAHNAGDTETCNRLHEANVALAAQAAGSSGQATYNGEAGTWDITTSDGSRIQSVDDGQNQKNSTTTYTTTSSNGRVSSYSRDTYTDESISAYMNYGGTNSGLVTSYNNAGNYVSTTGSYGTDQAQTSASAEVAVVKALLGLTNAQARQLQADLEASKQAYESAQADYVAAVQAGDTAAAQAARAQMDAAHAAAEATRAAYNYTGDSKDYNDGGYYYGNGTPKTGSDGGGFYITNVKPTYKITASASGGGTIIPSAEVSVKQGESVTFTMTPDSGARLLRVLVDGRNIGVRTSYTFTNVRAAHTIQAVFYKSYYSITASASTGGTISPSGTRNIAYNGSQSYTITPNSGYQVSRVLVDGTDVGAVRTYRFSSITDDHTIQAEFERNIFSITASASEGGTINPVGVRSVSKNGNMTYSFSANAGYQISRVLVDGADVGAVSTYHFTNITGDHTIRAEFERNTFSISASATEGGTITPAGVRSVSRNGSMTYQIAPNTGWKIKAVLVDGQSVGAVSSYTFRSITGDHSIAAQFERQSYSISASANQGGSISPSGISYVLYGGSLTFTVTPNAGYEVDYVAVDGQNKGQIGSYTFSNVSGAHSITAYFRIAGRIEVGVPSVTDSTGVTLNGGSIKSGYGIKVEVPVTAVGVTDVKVVLTYNFGNGAKTVNLIQSGSKYVLPANSTSPTGARVVYIPVETQDGTYTLNVTVTAKKVNGETLTDFASSTVTVRGNMYEDDFTGDS